MQPKGVSYHKFCHFLSKAAGGRAGRQRVRSQDLIGQSLEAGNKEKEPCLSGPHAAHVQMPMTWWEWELEAVPGNRAGHKHVGPRILS